VLFVKKYSSFLICNLCPPNEQYNSTTVQQYNSTTVQQYNKFNSLAKLGFVMFLLFTSSALLFTGCQKDLSNQPEVKIQSQSGLKIPNNFFKETILPGIVINTDNTIAGQNVPPVNEVGNPPSNPNNGDEQVLLGNQLPNPYTVANMQQAYNILYGPGQTLTANHMYVRFKPANEDQLGILEDNEDLELQDFPMDYAVTQDGDYYQDPNLGTEDISWLYAVVPVGYTPPAGIQYEILCTLYIPDNNTMLEGMAESIVDSTNTPAATYTVTIENGIRVITRTDIAGVPPMFVPPCGYFPYPDCEGGGGDNPPPPPPLPPGIYVEDQRACGATNTNTTVPLRIARVVCKRWFKVWRGYTNDLGRFTVTKTFRNNVKVIVKTKNNLAKISKVRGIRLWQMAFPVKRRIGVFAGNQLATLRFVFWKPVNAGANNAELPFWVATTTHNSNIEFRDYSGEFGLAQPPSDLRIIISNWGGGFSGTGSAPMFNKCHGAMATYFANHFIMSQSFLVAGDLNTLVASLVNRVDVIINYQAPLADYNCRLTSTWMKELAYHELGHASHYAQAGCDFWKAYRTAITTEISKTNQSNFHPYGTGNDGSTAPVIAIGEMWGNHCQYVYSNRHYGNGGTAAANFTARMQGIEYQNIGGGLNAHLNAIENHNPNANVIWTWIPEGLPYDLFDNANDNITIGNTRPIDNVLGYTNQQCFNALQSDVRSIPAFRDRLLQLNGNNQQAQINQLLQSYGY
jgi:hypothetical protein